MIRHPYFIVWLPHNTNDVSNDPNQNLMSPQLKCYKKYSQVYWTMYIALSIGYKNTQKYCVFCHDIIKQAVFSTYEFFNH